MDYRIYCKECDRYYGKDEIVICRNKLAYKYDQIIDMNEKCSHWNFTIGNKIKRKKAIMKCKNCKHMKIFKVKENEFDLICMNEESECEGNIIDREFTCNKFERRY